MARRVRHAAGSAEIAFMAVNDSHALAPYRQAALWFESEGVAALSGVVQAEANVPYVQWLNRACAALHAAGGGPRQVMASDLPDEQAAAWSEWLPAYGLCLPLASIDGILLLARDTPWSDPEIALLAEWMDTWRHAWRGLVRPSGWSWRRAPQLLRQHLQLAADRPWWKQRAVQWAAAAVVVLLFPVRLTVLAPGELVPSDAQLELSERPGESGTRVGVSVDGHDHDLGPGSARPSMAWWPVSSSSPTRR